MPAILIPLLAASLQRAGDLAIAMESRGYTGDFNRSGMEKLLMTRNDGLAMLAAGSLFIASLIGRG
jgi:energy-coupling factor transport system permease protein